MGTHAATSIGAPAAAVLAIVTLTGAARADVVARVWNSQTDYDYQVIRMPDVDQLRDAIFDVLGLPGGGISHCGPASVINLMGYAARHGLPELSPGFINYETPGDAVYNTVTQAIDDLGVLMGTTVTDGTSGNGMFDGTGAWLDDSGVSDRLVHAWWFATPTWSPKAVDMALQGSTGSIVGFCFGRYTITVVCNGRLSGTRDSGHCVTLTQATWSGTQRTIAYRDPVAGDSTFFQAPFASTVFTEQSVTWGPCIGNSRVMSEFAGPFGDGRRRIIDGMITIRGRNGFAFTPTEAYVVNPYVLKGIAGFGLTTPPMPPLHGNGQVVDLTPHPDYVHAFSIESTDPAQGGHVLVRRNMFTGETAEIDGLPGPGRLVFGRHRELFVLTGGMLVCYDVDVEPADVKHVETGVCGDAIAYDDNNDEVVVFCQSTMEMRRYGRSLGAARSIRSVPSTVPSTGRAILVCRKKGGGTEYVAMTTESSAVYELFPDSAGSFDVDVMPIAGATVVESVSCDEAGNWYLCVDGTTRHFVRGDTGDLEEVRGSPFAGIRACGFTIATSRTNYDPALHADWKLDVPPGLEEIEAAIIRLDCPSDLTRDGTVDFADLLELLAAWGSCPAQGPCAADIDDDDEVGFQDLLALLGAWGRCP